MYRNFRYWGFLSYSHDDRRVAERLHRALENYRIPSRLVGLDGPFGPVPARLLPVFRDRDELNAGGRLGPEVERALAISRSLIVLCSPAAAGSAWVDAEIAAFVRLQPDGPLFCVILAGEPLASPERLMDVAECLPATARARFESSPDMEGTAPIAVDLRADGDGWRLAIHKIVAGLTGLPLDQLVQRDAQRRHRRMAWLSTALATIVIALGLMAVLAYRARDEAREQRAQAEGLIEFMLVDLRKRLEPAGRLDALEAVGMRALGYYDQQSLKTLDPDSLGRRARALHLIGEIDDRRGDIKDARVAFAKARASTAELLERAPNHPQRLYDHAQSVYWNGYIDWQYGDTAGAERAFVEYGRITRKLSAQDPGNPDWLAEVGYAHSNLGALLLEQGRAAEAIPQFQQSLRINRKRSTLPGDADAIQLDIGQDRSWLSSALYANRQLRQAITERETELAIYDRLLAATPDDAQAQERQMLACRFLGEMYLSAGAMDLARIEIGRSLALADAQKKLDADNATWQQSAAETRVLAAQEARRTGKLRAAQRHLDVASSLLATQLAHDAEAWAWRVDIQESIAAEQAALFLREDNLPGAQAILLASQQRLDEIASDPPSAGRALRFRVSNLAMQAELTGKQKDFALARKHWRQITVLARNREERMNGETTGLLAEAWQHVGEMDKAGNELSRLAEAGYGHGAPRADGGADPASH